MMNIDKEKTKNKIFLKFSMLDSTKIQDLKTLLSKTSISKTPFTNKGKLIILHAKAQEFKSFLSSGVMLFIDKMPFTVNLNKALILGPFLSSGVELKPQEYLTNINFCAFKGDPTPLFLSSNYKVKANFTLDCSSYISRGCLNLQILIVKENIFRFTAQGSGNNDKRIKSFLVVAVSGDSVDEIEDYRSEFSEFLEQLNEFCTTDVEGESVLKKIM